MSMAHRNSNAAVSASALASYQSQGRLSQQNQRNYNSLKTQEMKVTDHSFVSQMKLDT